ncbi:MAG: cytidine deaminase [Patescibacteria group bacterium]|jgi:cytidine deaminase
MPKFKTAVKLTKEDKKLIKLAKSLVKPTKVPGGAVKEVGYALLTKKGQVYSGVSLHLSCGIGFCAEHSAVANMISGSNETEIAAIVAFRKGKVTYPCGRCREMLQEINLSNRQNCYIIISNKDKVKLDELLPGNWM